MKFEEDEYAAEVNAFRVDVASLEDAARMINMYLVDFVGLEIARTSSHIDLFFNTGGLLIESVLGKKNMYEVNETARKLNPKVRKECEKYVGENFSDDILIYVFSITRIMSMLERLIEFYGEKSLLLPLLVTTHHELFVAKTDFNRLIAALQINPTERTEGFRKNVLDRYFAVRSDEPVTDIVAKMVVISAFVSTLGNSIVEAIHKNLDEKIREVGGVAVRDISIVDGE